MFYKEFIDFCKFTRNLSPATVNNYVAVLSGWSMYLGENGLLSESVTEFDVYQFMKAKFTAGVKASSVNQYLVTISSYYNYCVRFHNDIFKKNPCETVQRMKVEQSLPVCLPKALLDKVVAELPAKTFKQMRSRAMFILMYHCGLRRAEVADLKRDDVDFTTGTIRVFGKERKTRLVPMSATLIDTMKQFDSLRMALYPYSEFFFCTVTSEHIDYRNIQRIIYAVLCHYVPDRFCHPHILRHSFATICLESGVSIENLSALMGHNSIETTMRYISISADRLRSQIKNVF